MKTHFRLTWLLPLWLGPALAAGSPDAARERFANPPADCRILKIIHGWPNEAAAQDALLGSLTNAGFGGVVCNVSFQDYLESEPKWGAFARAVGEARRAGLAMWLYDERGYPSGAAGGLVLRGHPEWEARGLLIAEAETDGGEVKLTLPPGTPVLTAGFPVVAGELSLAGRVDLSGQVRDGSLTWRAPAGRWRALAVTESRLYEGTHAQLSLADKLPYVNLLMAEPTARFLELTHQRYASHLGKDLGGWFRATFTDEPSLMGLFLRPMPYRVLPWAPQLPAEFRRRRGRELEPLLPALVADAGPTSQRARYEFWLTVGELVAENYFGQIQRWCREHGLPSGGHLLMEESLATHTPLYGDFFRCARRLDAPSVDCLTSTPADVPWFIARLLSSAAELEGRTLTMSETSDFSQVYRPAGDQRPKRVVTEAEVRGTCNRLFLGGINTITSYYSFTDLAPAPLRRLNDWVGRCCAALRGGHQVTDLAVVYPIESVWPRFLPSRHYANDCPAALRLENSFRAVSDALYYAGRDFTYVDAGALAEARVEAGTLTHGQLRWRVVVLPGADTLPWAAWEKLARFVRQGGVVISVGPPANTEREFPSARVRALAREWFGEGTTGPRAATNRAGGGGIYLPNGAESLLPGALDRVLECDVRLPGASADAPVRATHRRLGGQEVFFVVNDQAEAWAGALSLAATGPGEQWDPATGETRTVASADGLPLRLEGYGAALFRFPTARAPRRGPLASGPLPSLALRPLPRVEPTVGRGEFVREEVQTNVSGGGAGLPGWRITGTVTKGQVDTFLFAVFAYPQPLDLRGAQCLVLESRVPAGQRTPTSLLVVLREQGGADYLASTGRLLGAPGDEVSYLPLSRFQLAGWSRDDNGRLDLGRIAEVRVGWGGYYGSEGERVEFSLAPPQVAGR